MSMTERELEEIEKRVEAATGEPWYVGTFLTWMVRSLAFGNIAHTGLEGGPGGKQSDVNAEFIAHARQDIPNLLSEVRRSHAEAAERIKEIEFLRQQLSITTQERDQWDGNYCDLRLEMDKLEAENTELRERLQEEEE